MKSFFIKHVLTIKYILFDESSVIVFSFSSVRDSSMEVLPFISAHSVPSMLKMTFDPTTSIQAEKYFLAEWFDSGSRNYNFCWRREVRKVPLKTIASNIAVKEA